MKLFEVKDEIAITKIDFDFIKKYNKRPYKRMNYDEYNDYIIEKVKNGNVDAFVQCIKIIKDILVTAGCSDYASFKRKVNK